MPRRRSSLVMQNAEKRAANLTKVDAALDVGSGHTLVAFRAKIDDLRAQLDAYNGLMAQVEAAANNLTAAERDTDTESGTMLDGVGVKYGWDSNEYEMAGGTRKSERKKPTRKQKPTPPTR